MNIFHDFSEIEQNKNTVLTIGTFDGIHLGHKEIIKKITERTAGKGDRNFLITFNPHPRSVLSKNSVGVLTSLREKKELLNSLGIQNLLIVNFTKDFSRITAEEFIKDYLVKNIGVKEIVVGYDHHFGKGRSGDVQTLQELGRRYDFNVSSVEAYRINNKPVSSSEIRNLLKTGEVNSAAAFLGRYYSFSGIVVEGDRRGRELGFPTANIKPEDEDKILPALGVYAVEFILDNKKYYGLLSVGKRPTFYENGAVIPEVYIYDFNEDIYGKFVTVNIIDMIRGEVKYNSAEELIVQMNKDKAIGLEILSKQVE